MLECEKLNILIIILFDLNCDLIFVVYGILVNDDFVCLVVFIFD